MSRPAFAFGIAPTGRTATVEEGSDAHVKQMLELLIMTAIGERVMRPDYGSPVRQMVFEAGNGAVGIALQATLHATIGQSLGHLVELDTLDVAFDEATARLDVDVAYRVRTSLADDSLSVSVGRGR